MAINLEQTHDPTGQGLLLGRKREREGAREGEGERERERRLFLILKRLESIPAHCSQRSYRQKAKLGKSGAKS